MKKTLAFFLVPLLLLVSCSTKNYDIEPIEANAPNSATKETDNYNPFAKDNEPLSESATVGSYGTGVEWQEGKELVLEYAPVVSFRYFVENSGEDNDFGLMLFVNGFRQPYHTESDSENKIIHIIDVNKNEKKIQTIEFEPVVGDKGDEVSVEIVTIFNPNFIQNGNSNYEFNHRITSLYPSSLNITQITGASEPNICTNYESTPITDETRLKFVDTSNPEINLLDNNVYIEVLKNNLFYTHEDYINSEIDIQPYNKEDLISLCMYGGEPCTYRVSMYINHELVVGAFDGYDYIDITTSNDAICKKTIDINGLNLSLNKYNHIYFIAVPFYANRNYDERMVIKSDSVTFIN